MLERGLKLDKSRRAKFLALLQRQDPGEQLQIVGGFLQCAGRRFCPFVEPVCPGRIQNRHGSGNVTQTPDNPDDQAQ